MGDVQKYIVVSDRCKTNKHVVNKNKRKQQMLVNENAKNENINHKSQHPFK